MIYIGSDDERASPLQGQSLQFNPQRIELADFISIERRDESPFVLNTAHESFMLQRDEGLTHHGRSNVHLLCNLAFHDRGSGPEHAREKGILQSRDHPFS